MGTFHYGGQAVMEGVMMRGRREMAVAVRAPDGGIRHDQEPLTAWGSRLRGMKWPFVRGIVGLWDAICLGTRALMWAADVALGQSEEAKSAFNGPIGYATPAISLLFGVGLFFLLPYAATIGLQSLFHLQAKLFIVYLLWCVLRL